MLIIRRILSLLKDHHESMGTDTRTADLPLVKNHVVVLFILGFYVFAVRVLGPAFMAQRRAYNIKAIMQCYNVVQILLNLYIFVGGFSCYFLHPQYNWSCMNLDKNDHSPMTMGLRKYSYLYFISKFLDLLDTVFFVLRKKSKQVTYLHIYHHTIMIYATYLYMNIVFATQFTLIGAINSLVHVLMYIYYFLAAHNTKLNLEAWKPRMTQIQIIQFAIICIGLSIPMMNNWCGLPYFWLLILFFQNLYMLVLFSHFYRMTYIVKEGKSVDNTSKNIPKRILPCGNLHLHGTRPVPGSMS